MNRAKGDGEYRLQVKENGRWRLVSRHRFPKEAFVPLDHLRKHGATCRVMHGTVEVGHASGVF